MKRLPETAGWALGLAGAAITLVEAPAHPARAYGAYLVAYVFVLTVLLGALVFVMLAHATAARWPLPVRRLAEAALAPMPLVALLFVPVIAGMHDLYPWAHPEQVWPERARAAVLQRAAYFAPAFFVGRAVAYLVLWTAAARLLRRWSLRMDRPGAPDLSPRLKAASCALLPVLGITLTMAAFDWLLSLSPEFTSTSYGLYILAGTLAAGTALVGVLGPVARGTGALPALPPAHTGALGRLLLALIAVWLYCAYFQFLVAWMADRPVEVRFFLDRIAGRRPATIALVLLHFGLPFLLLLPREPKRWAFVLATAAALVLIGHYLDLHWLVLSPESFGAGLRWIDAAALLAVAGPTLAHAVAAQRGHAPVPVRIAGPGGGS